MKKIYEHPAIYVVDIEVEECIMKCSGPTKSDDEHAEDYGGFN